MYFLTLILSAVGFSQTDKLETLRVEAPCVILFFPSGNEVDSILAKDNEGASEMFPDYFITISWLLYD